MARDLASYRSQRRVNGEWYQPVEPIEVRTTVTPSMAKSADWRRHAHRFWIAAPVQLATKIANMGRLPLGWGLLAVSPGKSIVLAKPTLNPNPEPFNQVAMLGMLRAAADAGLNVMQRRYEDGFAAGKAAAERAARSAEQTHRLF
jgi:hypothetical protein